MLLSVTSSHGWIFPLTCVSVCDWMTESHRVKPPPLISPFHVSGGFLPNRVTETQKTFPHFVSVPSYLYVPWRKNQRKQWLHSVGQLHPTPPTYYFLMADSILTGKWSSFASRQKFSNCVQHEQVKHNNVQDTQTTPPLLLLLLLGLDKSE